MKARLTLSHVKLGGVYGLVFLFKWRQDEDEREAVHPEGLFFAQQVITNACATQAILSILLNAPDVELGETLSAFKDFTCGFSPRMKGLSISNSEPLREAHNSFARPEPFELAKQEAQEDDDVFHFISYVPFEGAVYELDGLKPGPIRVVDRFQGSWFNAVVPVVQARIASYASKEIRFNIMAVVPDPRDALRAEVARLEQSGGEHGAQLFRLHEQLSEEDAKRSKWRAENVRRRHNYVPFLLELMRGLGERSLLGPMIEQAEEKVAQRKK